MNMMTSEVTFRPRGAVAELFRCRAPEVLLSGGTGTGKSVGALMKIHLACLTRPKVRAVILRKTHASLTGSTLTTFREKVAREAIETRMVVFYGGSQQEPAAFRYRNGSTILVGGLDKASRLLSTEFDLIFVDEAIEVSSDDLDTLTTRLRNGVLSYQQMIMCTNPGPPTHHLKKRADTGRCVLLHSRHEDNPRMYDADRGQWTDEGQRYLTRLESIQGVEYERRRWGKWVAADGLIYDKWEEQTNVVDSFPIPHDWTRWWTIDWGFTAPFVWQDWREDPDGRLYLVREFVKTQQIVEDHVREIKRMVLDRNGGWLGPIPTAVICDHDATDRATFERHMELATVPARKGRTAGIQAMQSRIGKASDGKPRLMVFRDAVRFRDPVMAEAMKPVGLREEIAGYVWAVKPNSGGDLKEEPHKENDHSMDAARYMCAHRDSCGAPNIRWLGSR